MVRVDNVNAIPSVVLVLLQVSVHETVSFYGGNSGISFITCPYRNDSWLQFSLKIVLKPNDSVSNHQPRDCLLNRLFGRKQRKHQSPVSLAFVRGIHRGPVNSPHKWPVTRKMFTFGDVIMVMIWECYKCWLKFCSCHFHIGYCLCARCVFITLNNNIYGHS